FSCPVEMLQTVLWPNGGFRTFTPRNHSDYLAGGFPLDTVTGPDIKPVRDRFWHRDLELTRDLAHVLTIPRTLSLSSFHLPSVLNIARLRKQYGGGVPLTPRPEARLVRFFYVSVGAEEVQAR